MPDVVLVDNRIEPQLSKLLFWGNYEDAVCLMQQHKIPANSIFPDRYYTSLIETVISGCEQNNALGQNNHYPLLEYLLDNGADVTVQNKDGYSALSLAAIEPKKLKYLELILKYPVTNINSKEKSHGHTVLLNFIKDTYSRLACISVSLKHRCLEAIELFLQKGADPCIENRYQTSAKSILRYHIPESEAVMKLFDKYKSTDKAVVIEAKSLVPETLQYPDTAKEIWKTLVPKSGASDTVQGELLRSVEKLRDEAQRNGNINFGSMHKAMAKFIEKILVECPHFTGTQKEEICAYIEAVSKKNHPYTEDDAYDYLTDKICEFYIKEPVLIPIKTKEA